MPSQASITTKIRARSCGVKRKWGVDAVTVFPGTLSKITLSSPWLDGIADTNGTVRQFVATPFGSGFSVESQITGNDAAGGLQFEIVPYVPRRALAIRQPSPVPRPTYTDGPHMVFVKMLDGKTITLRAHEDETVDVIKVRIEDKEGLPPHIIRLIYQGKQLEDGWTLRDYRVHRESTFHLALRLVGGSQAPIHEMSVAAGGRIRQVIEEDKLGDGMFSFLNIVFELLL
jgi:hypothetical protein